MPNEAASFDSGTCMWIAKSQALAVDSPVRLETGLRELQFLHLAKDGH